MIKIKNFIKKEIVLVISFILCVLSCFFVKVDKQYINYIDFRTLSLLYCLMITVSGLRKAGTFSYLAHILIVKATNTRIISLILVCLSFFSSMLITNDVALLTFVPFAVVIFENKSHHKILLITVILQTVAANLGSMLKPVGNPQNLYVQSYYGLSASDFISITFPIWVISLISVILLSLFIPNTSLNTMLGEAPTLDRKTLLLYIFIFLICILSVLRILKWQIMLITVIIIIAICDKKTLINADFFLLLTFIFFFIFSGNLARINPVESFLSSTLDSHEYIVSLLTSQIISNVPATLLLSGFTSNYKDLLLGVDIGGLGTPIASLASLISLKLYTHCEHSDIKKYLLIFTVTNCFLIIFLTICKILI